MKAVVTIITNFLFILREKFSHKHSYYFMISKWFQKNFKKQFSKLTFLNLN